MAQTHAQRFVTVVGPPGIGKTAAALAAAQRLAPSYSGGALFVDLAPVEESRHVASALAAILGVPSPAADAFGGIAASLAEKRALLVLDNCEHVASAAAALAEAALGAGPESAVLATSREPLRARGEWVSRIGPLPVPPQDRVLTAECATKYPAVELFVERASATLDGYVLTDGDAAAVAELCRRLEGNPLAIEIAAARVPAFGAQGLLDRLDDRLRLMMSGHRTSLPRQQTLRGAMDWSYETLSDRQREVLRRLAVFPGWFDLSAATAVAACNGGTETEAIEDLADLVDKSLIATDVSGTTVFYRLLATTRAYALEKLAEHHETDETHRRHAMHTLQRVRSAGVIVTTGSVGPGPDQLRALLDDVRAALRWAFSGAGDPRLAGDLSLAAAPVATCFALHAEFLDYLFRAREALIAAHLYDATTAIGITTTIAVLELHTGGDAVGFEEAIVLADAHGTDDQRAVALEGLWARSLFVLGDYERAILVARRHLSITSKAPESPSHFNSKRLLGHALHFAGQHAPGLALLDQVMAHDAGARPQVAFQIDRRVSAGISIARIHWLRGHFNAARELTSETLSRAASYNHAVSLCLVLAMLACPLSFWDGDLAEAERRTEELVSTSTKHSLGQWATWGRVYRHALSVARGRAPLIAANHLQRETMATLRTDLAEPEVFAAAERGQRSWCTPDLLRCAAESCAREEPERAVSLLRRSLEVGADQGVPFWELRAATSLATLLRDAGQIEEARVVLRPRVERFSPDETAHALGEAKSVLATLRGPELFQG